MTTDLYHLNPGDSCLLRGGPYTSSTEFVGNKSVEVFGYCVQPVYTLNTDILYYLDHNVCCIDITGAMQTLQKVTRIAWCIPADKPFVVLSLVGEPNYRGEKSSTLSIHIYPPSKRDGTNFLKPELRLSIPRPVGEFDFLGLEAVDHSKVTNVLRKLGLLTPALTEKYHQYLVDRDAQAVKYKLPDIIGKDRLQALRLMRKRYLSIRGIELELDKTVASFTHVPNPEVV